MRTKLDAYAEEIESAREKVAEAMQDYSRGRAGIGKVNKANDDLAQAHASWRECMAGTLPDKRR